MKDLLHPKVFSTKATEWGKENDSVVLQKYVCWASATDWSHRFGYLQSGICGLWGTPFYWSITRCVCIWPSSVNQFGIAEIKFPYKYRELTPIDASKHSDFCCKLATQSDRTSTPELKHTHPYYAQIRGQLAVTEKKWCDFVIFTNKGISIEQIEYDREIWGDKLLPKLISFYDNCLCPSIVSPVHLLGMKAHDLRVQPSRAPIWATPFELQMVVRHLSQYLIH